MGREEWGEQCTRQGRAHFPQQTHSRGEGATPVTATRFHSWGQPHALITFYRCHLSTWLLGGYNSNTPALEGTTTPQRTLASMPRPTSAPEMQLRSRVLLKWFGFSSLKCCIQFPHLAPGEGVFFRVFILFVSEERERGWEPALLAFVSPVENALEE